MRELSVRVSATLSLWMSRVGCPSSAPDSTCVDSMVQLVRTGCGQL